MDNILLRLVMIILGATVYLQLSIILGKGDLLSSNKVDVSLYFRMRKCDIRDLKNLCRAMNSK